MNDLAILIEYLLLTRDSVVVPGLGVFTTRTFASQWSEEEDLFLPPVRHIRFSSDVFQDSDNVFLNAVQQIYGMSEEQANSYCSDVVSLFHKTLVVEGTLDFGSIGLFNLEDDAEISMSPYECGITTPSMYGLDTLHFPMLSEQLSDSESPIDVTVENNQDGVEANTDKPVSESSKKLILPKSRTYVADDKHIIFRLNRTFVHYTMVAAASVLLFFLLSPVKDDSSADKFNQTVATTNVILPSKSDTKKSSAVAESTKKKVAVKALKDTFSLIEKSEKLEESAKVVVKDSVSCSSSSKVPFVDNSKLISSDGNLKIVNELRGSYSVILASSITRRNAMAFVEKLEKEDIHSVIYDNGRMLRVLIDGFASKSDAYNMNNYLHKLGKDFCATWVMKN